MPSSNKMIQIEKERNLKKDGGTLDEWQIRDGLNN